MSDESKASATFPPNVIAEIHRAAREGIYSIRGSAPKRKVPNFDDLVFLGASMSRYPLEGYRERCDTDVVIGARHASKPIKLEIPITIAGMSFGALGANAKKALGLAATAMGTSTTTGDGGMTEEEREASKTLIYQYLPSRYGMTPDQLNEAIQSAMTDLIRGKAESLDPAIPAVLAGHVSVSQARTSSEQTMMLGRDHVLLMSAVALPQLDYIALGHVHVFRDVSQNGVPAFYSGAPSGAKTRGAVLVELDPETGAAKLTRYTAIDDVGRAITDRTTEHLGVTDIGIIFYRKMIEENLRIVEDGGDPINVHRDPATNDGIMLATEHTYYPGDDFPGGPFRDKPLIPAQVEASMQ